MILEFSENASEGALVSCWHSLHGSLCSPAQQSRSTGVTRAARSLLQARLSHVAAARRSWRYFSLESRLLQELLNLVSI